MQKLPLDAVRLGLVLGLGNLNDQAKRPCHGFQNGCKCPRHRRPKLAPCQPAQPWEARRAA